MPSERPADPVAANRALLERLISAPAQPETEGGYVLRGLETVGRRSGAARRTPIGVLQRDGHRYLVSPDPGRDWVRNLDATPRGALLAAGERDFFDAVRVTGDEAAGVVRAYLTAVSVPWARAAYPVGPDASEAEMEAALPGIAVFRLDPTQG